MNSRLLRAAVDYVREQGGTAVEGYPIVPRVDQVPTLFAFTGFASVFEAEGFVEALRRSETRPIMRLYLEEGGA